MQQSRANGGSEAEVRPASAAQGMNVRLDDSTVERVKDAARRADVDNKVFIEEAVRDALNDRADRNAKVEVQGLRHSDASGRISMGRPATEAAEQAAAQSGGSPRGAVVAAVRRAADGVRRADEMERQSTGTGPALPVLDPLGFIERATGGAFADPLGQMLRGQAAPGGGQRGGRRGR
jgi:predicted transcriptional regulator